MMDIEAEQHPDRQATALFVALALITLAILGLFGGSGCSTVTPGPVGAQVASFDGGTQNSGILRMDAALGGFVVTPHFVARYDALVAVYGDTADRITGLPYFVPALTLRYGLSKSAAGEYVLSPEAMTYFVRMNQWRRAGRQPR